MVGAEDIARRANEAGNAALSQASTLHEAGRYVDAKKVLTNGQQQLRNLKSEAVAEEREIRAQFQQARLDVNKTGQTLGMFMGSKARGTMGRARAYEKRGIAQQQQDALEPYRQLKTGIDAAIAELSTYKIEIDSDAANAKAGGTKPKTAASSEPQPVAAVAAPAPTAPPPPPTPAQWATDPFGRHEHRWWDGSKWTEHVASRGQQSTDPPS
jgi:hypothetical protein